MKQGVLIVLVSLFYLSAIAQEGFKGEHFIEVSGSAEMEIEPNEIVLSIKLREFEENKQKVSLDKIDASFLEAVKASGIDRKKLELAGGGASLEKINRRDKDSFREKSYQLTLSSANELEKFIGNLDNVKVYQAYISRVDHTDKEKFRLDLKIKALQAAKAKAETLLKSIGSEMGKTLTVRELDFGVQPYERLQMTSNVAMDSATGGVYEEPLAFKKMKFREQIIVQFEIK